MTLEKNGFLLTCNENDLFKFILKIAQHKIVPREATDIDDREVAEIAYWIWKHSRRIEAGDRVISWRRLEKILRAYGCEMELAHGVGNRMNILRTEEKRRYILPRKKIIYRTQVYCAGMGTDVDLSVTKKIRKDLCLDDENGIDSNYFYKNEPHTIDDFINRYRRTLTRLSKL